MKNNPLLAPRAQEATHSKTKTCLCFYVNSQAVCSHLVCCMGTEGKIGLYPPESSTLPIPTKM